MIHQTDFSLKPYNTFGINALASHFVDVKSEDELIIFLASSKLAKNLKLILGGGSNLLLTGDIFGTVLHINLQGKRCIQESETEVIVEAHAGENWHDFVLWSLKNDWGGLENLSLIPGNVGTAPMQNIGAYGIEIKDLFHSLDAVEIQTGKRKVFTKEDCLFGYRESVFKNRQKGRYIITKVRFKLTKVEHKISTHYGAIQDQLAKMNVSSPSIQDVSKAVIAIRKSKLPDPAEIGNSGSFFKNPIIPVEQANELAKTHPNMPIYPAKPGTKKVAAGWLIDQAGWKGYRSGDAGVHKKQALVLVNYDNATGKEILNLAEKIMTDIKNRFGISLQPEVNIIR